MINSLNIDSHISKSSPQNFRLQTPTENVRQEKLAVNKNGIIKRETANVNFCGLSAKNTRKPLTAARIGKFRKVINLFYKNEKTKKALDFINKQNLIFDAGFALILTCLLRPASIMMIPENKKNKDDKIYASAHSIASGIIGFGISNVLFYPLSEGLNRLKDAPTSFINKDSKLLKNEKLLSTACTYLERMPDIVFAIPKATLTIALIPPILKHCFGWEKKKSTTQKTLDLIDNYQLLNFKNSQKTQNAAFKGINGGTN